MRLSDVLGAEVRDGNDRVLGIVRDVRATADQDEGGRWRELRVEGVVVASRWLPRAGVDRPWILGWIDRRFERASRFVEWERVESVDRSVVRVRLSPNR
jgi:hypothetical protein